MRERGWPEELVLAVGSHADYMGIPRDTPLRKSLYACDELSGLVYACCLVRPNGIDDLKPRSVVKKLKDKAFAAGVDRDDVARGVELIGLERSEHIQNVIDGMRAVAEELGVRAGVPVELAADEGHAPEDEDEGHQRDDDHALHPLPGPVVRHAEGAGMAENLQEVVHRQRGAQAQHGQAILPEYPPATVPRTRTGNR